MENQFEAAILAALQVLLIQAARMEKRYGDDEEHAKLIQAAKGLDAFFEPEETSDAGA